jgi:hypothetical protein
MNGELPEGFTLDIANKYQNGELSPQATAAAEELANRGRLDLTATQPEVASEVTNIIGSKLPEGFTIDEPEEIEEPEELDFIKPMSIKSMISGAIENTPKSAKQFVTDLVTPFLHPKDTAKALGALGEGLAQKFVPGRQENEQIVDDLVEMFKERYGGIENIKKTISEDPVGVVADISSLLVPAGAVAKGVGAISKVEKVSKLGRLTAKAGELLEPVSAVGKAVKGVVSKIIPKEMPTNLYQSAAKFSTVIPENIRKSLSTTALDNRIMPTLKGLDNLRENINSINDEITTLIDGATKSGKQIPINALFTHFKKLRKDALLSGEPISQKRAIDNIARQISKANRKVKKGFLSPGEAQKLKQNIYKETESLYSKATQRPIKGKTKQAVAKAAKESLEKLFPEIKQLNRNEGSLLALRKELEKSASRISNRDLLGIGIPIKGGAGGAIGGMPGLLGGAALGLFDTPAVKAKLAIVLNSLKKKGVVLAEDSLMKQMLEMAPGGGAITARQAGRLEEQTEEE